MSNDTLTYIALAIPSAILAGIALAALSGQIWGI
jgi:hypothetical protein